MRDQPRIGRREAFWLVVIFIITKVFLAYPRTMAEIGETAAWVVIIVGGLVSALAWWVLGSLLNRHPGASLIEAARRVGGTAAALAVGLGFTAMFVFMAATVLRQFGETIINAILPEMPISAILIPFVVVFSYAAYQGVEPLTRVTWYVTPWIVGGAGVIVAMTLALESDVGRLFPLLGTGPAVIIPAGALRSSMFIEMVLVGLLRPSLDPRVRPVPFGLACLSTSVAIFVVIQVAYLTSFPPPLAGTTALPMYTMARLIAVGRFVQRVESVMFFIWVLAGCGKLTAAVYAASVSLAESLRLPAYRPLIFPLAVLVLTLSFLPENLSEATRLDADVLRVYGIIPAFVLPALVWLIDLARGSRHAKA